MSLFMQVIACLLYAIRPVILLVLGEPFTCVVARTCLYMSQMDGHGQRFVSL